VYTYNNPGSFAATLTVTDEGGLTATDQVNIEVEEPVVNPVDFALYYNTGSANTVFYQGHEFVGDESIANQINSDHTYTNLEASSEPLFQTERGATENLATLSYTIPVPNGEYQVTTYHNELYWGKVSATGGAGNRVFDILLEGNVVETGVDLFLENNNGPVQFTNTVLVNDGVLNIDLPASVNRATISGLAIEGEINEAPTAIAVATPLSGTAPLEVSFDASGSTDTEGGLTYAWDFGNGDSSNEANPVYTYDNPGSFAATLTVTDEGGLIATDQITIEVVEPVVDDCGPLPSPWASSDVGAVASEGEACFNDGRFEVSASGTDIFGSADEFHYVYQELNGDGEIIAQVMNLDQTDNWAKAGVMIRGDLDSNAAMAMMILAPNPNNLGSPGFSFQSRPSKGGSLGTGNYTLPEEVPGGFPHYVRLVRSGNTFTGYVSETNGNWIEVGSANITMGQSVFVGLATTSHNDGVLTNAVYDNVEVNQEFQIQTTAFAQPTSNKFSVSPNPSSVETSLSFELPTMIETIYIYNMSGSLLKTIKGGLVDDQGTPLDIQELPVGVYIIIAKDKNGREYQQKLLVDPR